MRELALFAGAGGGILGGNLLGWETVCAVEIEDYARRVLLQRQRDGLLPLIPIWDDIRTFDGRPWRGRCDIVTGGFPCQDISLAGKRAGIDGARSGLWSEMARIIREVRPRFAFVENVPGLTGAQKILLIILEKIRQLDLFRARDKNTIGGRFRRLILKIVGPSYLGRVLGDLADLGYDARWCVLGADDAGAPHYRKRIWILAYSKIEPEREQTEEANPFSNKGKARNESIYCGKYVADSYEIRRRKRTGTISEGEYITATKSKDVADPYEKRRPRRPDNESVRDVRRGNEAEGCSKAGNTWSVEPSFRRVAHGFPSRVDRLKVLGNAQVPAVAALAFLILSEGVIYA